MKKITTILLFSLLFTISANAQGFKVGGGLGYGTEISSLGIYANGVYSFNKKIEAAGAFTYFLESDGLAWYALDFDAHYVLSSNKKFEFYGLAGVNITFWSFEFEGYSAPADDFWGNAFDVPAIETSGSEIGLNIGAGGRLAISEKMQLVGEAKYTIGGSEYLMIKAGVLFSL